MQWKILPKKSDDVLKQLLINRRVQSEREKELFLNPQLVDFANAFKIPGIAKAQKRIMEAIKNQELIIVYGDYDVDGICGSAVLYKALTSIGARVLPYIPHREKEGYGLSKIGLDFARDSAAAVVITVDNGIVAIEQAQYANQLGLDLIITDHHQPLDKKPACFALVHSTKMCGTAVAWCLVKDLIKGNLAHELLQFVAIATICDLMQLTHVNRVLVKEGLKVLNQTKNLGLLSLISQTQLVVGGISSLEVGFIIGPRLNAIGRLEHAIDALRLLCTKDPKKARDLARLLCDKNSLRQLLTESAMQEAKLKIGENKNINVLHSKDWQPGIIGLIAARVCEISYKPAIVISVGEGFSKGSARSVDGINIVEVIRQCSDILIDVGGHKGAAGFSIENENIEKFISKIEKLAQVFPKGVPEVLEIEAEVEPGKITQKLAHQLEDFAPFGFGNPNPILATHNMRPSDLRVVGGAKHLKGRLDNIEFIAFGAGSLKDVIGKRMTNVAYNLEINRFNGSEILQMKIKDFQLPKIG